MSYEQRIIKLIESDELRMRALRTVRALNLPDWLIAAGFVRNISWNSLYGNDTTLNDIDVIYYCLSDSSKERDNSLQNRLLSLEPELPWSVKNQARMHLRNGDAPYRNTLDAMGHWPEKQTAIGVMLDHDDRLILRSSFDLSLQFNGLINRNPEKSVELFKNRVTKKGWLETWPKLQPKT